MPPTWVIRTMNCMCIDAYIFYVIFKRLIKQLSQQFSSAHILKIISSKTPHRVFYMIELRIFDEKKNQNLLCAE